MNFLHIIGYDHDATIKDLPTTLHEGSLSTFDISLSALGFNAPAWIAASSMSILYAISGNQSPLAILIAFIFPMLALALGLIYLTRHAPSAGGIFTFTSRFIHSRAGTVLGWTYAVSCAIVAPMCALIGTQYIQALLPSLAGPMNANIIGTLMIVTFLGISCRGITVTAKIASVFLIFEIAVVAGLGLMGLIQPHVEGLSVASMYSLSAAGGWSGIGPGVLFGVWMLANFDSAINYIEEARYPVRTVQRSLIIVLTIAFCVYSIAAIGWQFAVPVKDLAAIVEGGNGGPIAAVANIYLPPSISWIALFVVITSAAAGLQISTNSCARTLYRMSHEGHLPPSLSQVNRHRAPWVAILLVGVAGIGLIWWKPLADIIWYYDAVTITLVISYIAALLSFVILVWRKNGALIATALSIPALAAMAVLGYIGYTAGANPVTADDIYNAWYLGIAALASGILIATVNGRNRLDVMPISAESSL